MKQISRPRALLALPLFASLQISAAASSPAWCQSSSGFLAQGPVVQATTTSAVGTVAAAGSTVLWEQLPDSTLSSNVDQEFPDLPEFSSYQVSDVILSSDSTINSVCIWVTGDSGSAWITGVSSARLNIFTNNPLLATDDPSVGDIVAVTVTEDAGSLKIEATGLSIAASAGLNWIGLTPIGDFGVVGQEFHLGSNPLIGSESFLRNPGGGFGFSFGMDWGSLILQDSSIRVCGESSDTSVGTALCSPANANSTGVGATLTASGSDVAMDNDLTFLATDLPLMEAGFLLNSMNTQMVSISEGLLCIGPGLGRHVDMVGSTGMTGEFSTTVNLLALPRSSGPEPALAGQTWYFQVWYRDGAGASNFTNALEILFQ